MLKLSTIRKSLENLLSGTTDENERNEILQSISECQELLTRYESSDIWDEEVFILSPNSFIDLFENLVYDHYGRLVKSNGSVTQNQFNDMVRNNLLYTDLTDNCLQTGFEVISDLWNDNEVSGYHNEDGTYNKDY